MRRTASGGFAAISFASSSAVGSKSSCGTTRETRRSSLAVVASMTRAGVEELGRSFSTDELREPPEAGDVAAEAALDEQLTEPRPLRRTLGCRP